MGSAAGQHANLTLSSVASTEPGTYATSSLLPRPSASQPSNLVINAQGMPLTALLFVLSTSKSLNRLWVAKKKQKEAGSLVF
mmetsp:Transcript_13121/g.35725  ORF Transcript_13121/g.35725 Transcript_13121/m.35725 type:complete len:82 (+) Transcript_13121:203-448(+)